MAGQDKKECLLYVLLYVWHGLCYIAIFVPRLKSTLNNL